MEASLGCQNFSLFLPWKQLWLSMWDGRMRRGRPCASALWYRRDPLPQHVPWWAYDWWNDVIFLPYMFCRRIIKTITCLRINEDYGHAPFQVTLHLFKSVCLKAKANEKAMEAAHTAAWRRMAHNSWAISPSPTIWWSRWRSWTWNLWGAIVWYAMICQGCWIRGWFLYDKRRKKGLELVTFNV